LGQQSKIVLISTYIAPDYLTTLSPSNTKHLSCINMNGNQNYFALLSQVASVHSTYILACLIAKLSLSREFETIPIYHVITSDLLKHYKLLRPKITVKPLEQISPLPNTPSDDQLY
jgi:hypothetical protein